MMNHFYSQPLLPRRDMLKIGAGAMIALGLNDAARVRAGAAPAAKTPAKNCVIVWLTGGPATIDMWDLKPTAPAHIRGDFAPIETTAAGVSICEHLPQIAKVMDRCALVRSVSHTLADHAPGTELVATGHAPTPALVYPTFGALAGKLLLNSTGGPSFMTVGDNPPGSSGFLGAAASPLAIRAADLTSSSRANLPVELPDKFSAQDLERRDSLLRRLDAQFAALDNVGLNAELSALERQAVEILRSNKIRQALDIQSEPEKGREAYGRGWPGQALLAARRLVESGVRVVTATISGLDTHNGNFAQLRTALLPQLDRALAALVADLDTRGLLGETIIYCAGEFGRTPIINPQAGRDHWPRAMSVFLAGGPLPRGAAHGATDAQGMEPTAGACAPGDVNATLLAALGVSRDASLTTPSGRPITAMGDGAPIESLLQRSRVGS